MYYFRGELGFLKCDDICMCIVNKQFELLELVFDSVYVGLQYDEISLTSTALSVSLRCDVFGLSVRLSWYHMWMRLLTVIRVLLFVLHVCIQREREGAMVTAMLVFGMDEV